MFVLVDTSALIYKTWNSNRIKAFGEYEDEQASLSFMDGRFIPEFCHQLFKVIVEIEKFRPLYLKVWLLHDGAGSNKLRRLIYPQYKKSRRTADDFVKNYVTVYRYFDQVKNDLAEVSPRFAMYDTFAEADDLLAAMCHKYPDIDKVIVTRDKDLYQLVNDKTVVLKNDTLEWVTAETVENELGVSPSEVVALKSLMGDSSDNYPGVKGIGSARAIKIISEGKHIDTLYPETEVYKKLATLPYPEWPSDYFYKQLGGINIESGARWDRLIAKYPKIRTDYSFDVTRIV